MGRRLSLRLLACLLFLLPAAGLAEVTYPMAAVGVLGSRAAGGCSAALIAPDIVLTAAHCVDKNQQDGQDLVFRTGAYPGVPRVETPVAGIAFHPLYGLNLKPATTRIRFDLAVVRLARPVDAPGIEPLRLGPAPQAGEHLLLASYRGGQGERARERRCEVFPGPPDLAALGCEVKGGESGAPVIRTGPDGPEIAAVMSSQSRFNKQPIGFAPPVLPRIGPVFELLPDAPPATEAAQPGPVEVTVSP
jgi:protease YdgD